MEPVMSAGAARVTLSAPPEELRMKASGKLTLAPEILAAVTGAPVIQVVNATEPKLLEAELSELTAAEDGYIFTVTWPEGAMLRPLDETRVFFRTAFDVMCEGGSRLVQATTEVHLCGGFENVPSAWASPGDNCAVCRIIAELAASPIIPEHQASGLPLGQALRARVVELARVGQSVVLFAENDGGDATSYEWHASGGRVEQIAPDVVIWHLEPGEAAASMQVAIVADAGVAVVSYAFEGGLH
jgi:YD repeat-containing protein